MLADTIPMFDMRRQDTKNRQNSIDDIDPFVKQEFEIKIRRHFNEAMVLYQSMLDKGIAKNVLDLCFLWQHRPGEYEWFLSFCGSTTSL